MLQELKQRGDLYKEVKNRLIKCLIKVINLVEIFQELQSLGFFLFFNLSLHYMNIM